MDKKPVYLIGDIQVKNMKEYKKYVAQVTPVAAKFGGKYLIRGGTIDTIETNKWKPNRIVLIRFPNKEAAMSWYHSEEYKPIKKIRADNSISEMIFVEGAEPN